MPRPSLLARPAAAAGRPARAARLLTVAAAVGLLAGCAAGAAGPGPGEVAPASGASAGAGGGGATGSAASAAQPATAWPTRTRESLDLWLHGMAMLVDDTARVPIFRRGYREQLRVVRQRANVLTQLDAERDRLRQRLAAAPALALNAQFVPLPFDSWEELRAGLDALVQTGGDPRRAPDQLRAQMVAYLAGIFPTASDREWARLFGAALQDEYARFYHQHWLAEQRGRAAILAASDSVWQRAARPRLQRFLNNSQQKSGTLLLSPVLAGEGRTQGGAGGGLMAVGLPPAGGDPAEPSYTAVHELVGTLAASAVSDNVTPAEQRTGVADRYVSAAQVRGGLLVLQRLAPELARGYARFYLREAGLAEGSDPVAALERGFPLAAPILASFTRQLDTVLGGI